MNEAKTNQCLPRHTNVNMALREHTIEGFTYKYTDDKLNYNKLSHQLCFYKPAETLFTPGINIIHSGIFVDSKCAKRLVNRDLSTVCLQLHAYKIKIIKFEILDTTEVVFLFENINDYALEVIHPIYIFVYLFEWDWDFLLDYDSE